MPEPGQRVETASEPALLSAGDREAALDLVAERQIDRAESGVRPADVPRILVGYQARWHADPAPVRLGAMSRRIGKSWGTFAAEGALEAARAGRAGMDQLYMGYNLEMAAEQIGDVAWWARAYGAALDQIAVAASTERRVTRDAAGRVLDEQTKSVTKYSVRFASGHVYEALSSNPWAWRGRQGHARIDEAAFHTDLDEVVTAALAYLMLGGRVSIISSVDTDDDQFTRYIREIQAGKLPWSLHLVTLDDAIRDGYYRQVVCLKKGIEYVPAEEVAWRDALFAAYPDQAKAQAELLCIPRAGSGLYFSRLILERCMVDRVPIVRWNGTDDLLTDSDRIGIAARWCQDHLAPVLDNLPADQRSVYAQDFGRSADLSAIRLFQCDSPRHWVERAQLELRNLPFDVQAHIRDFILDRLPLLHGAGFDARGNGSSHAEAALQKYGARVQPIMATAQWYDTWFPRYRDMHESQPPQIAIARSEDLIADHRLVEVVKGRPRMGDGRVKGSDGQYRHGDTAAAGVIAAAVMLSEGEPAAGETVPDTDPRETYRADRPTAVWGQRD